MAYPTVPFASHSWRISHHQGILSPKVLSALLFAASTYQESRDPTQEINTYLVTNGVFPPNIREDSQQPDVWRDYQQVLPEIGLMHSTRRSKGITLSPVGLSYLDGGLGFTDLATIQAFRWQYPNGHNTQRSGGDTSPDNFAAQQASAGVLIKPAVFLWEALDRLSADDRVGHLTAAEIEHFIIPAKTHSDVELAVAAIRHNRSHRNVFPSGQTKQRRNASDWMKRLSQTHPFIIDDEDRLCLSAYSSRNLRNLRILMQRLTEPAAFWIYPSDGNQAESWYLWYGTLDSTWYPIPEGDEPKDFGNGPEPEDEHIEEARRIDLSPLIWTRSEFQEQSSLDTISSVYSADLSNKAHRLHDSMVRLIAAACERERLKVFSDPATLDLLIEFDNEELLIEVKSATYLNLGPKVRSALGQITYYDFLRSKQTSKIRRKAVALTLGIGNVHWAKNFLTDYLNVDLVTLREGRLFTYSQKQSVADLLS